MLNTPVNSLTDLFPFADGQCKPKTANSHALSFI